MRITVILSILFSATFFLSNCKQVLAQSSTSSAQIATSSAKIEDLMTGLPSTDPVDVGKSRVAASSPLYFIKAVRERVEEKLATKKSQQLKVALEHLQRRLRETITLISEKRWDLVESTMEHYRSQMNKTSQIAGGDATSRMQLALDISRHLDILQRLYSDSADLRAKEGILASLEKGEEYNRKLVIELDTSNQQLLIGQIALRQAQACLFLSQQISQVNVEATRELLSRQSNECKISLQKEFKDQLDALRKRK